MTETATAVNAPTETLSGVALPDVRGYFGAYGGRFVPETLVPALDELTAEYLSLRYDPAFQAELADLHRTSYAANLCQTVERTTRRRADLSQA